MTYACLFVAMLIAVVLLPFADSQSVFGASETPGPMPQPRNGIPLGGASGSAAAKPAVGIADNGTGAPAPQPPGRGGPVTGSQPGQVPGSRSGLPFGTPAAQCHDLGDGAVDQNRVSVDVWAPGLRSACGQLGYENGDNPMPAGTPLPAPRPFRFDYAYDHNEPVHGFKVFYWNGDANHCGDMRLIFHQGGAVSGFTIRYHTFQFAIALCDSTGHKRIIDVGGQADTGALVLESQPSNPIGTLPDSGAMRFTADINSCSGRPGSSSGGCVTAWYPEFDFDVPGSVMAGVSVELSVVRPITLADPNDLTRVVLTNSRGATNWDGVARELGNWVIFNLGSGSQTTWWTVWDVNQGKQVIVPAGTPGAWQMRVDAGIAARGDGVLIANCVFGFSCARREHANPVAGIVYPN